MKNEQTEWSPNGMFSSKGTHYILEGDESAELVVFVHGIGTYSFCFEDSSSHLRENGKQTLRFDNLGMGHTVYPPNADDPEVWKGLGHVEQLHDLIVELNLSKKGKYTLIGHSMGGAISTIYAATYPSEVKSIVLLSPAGLMSPWSQIGVVALRTVVPRYPRPLLLSSSPSLLLPLYSLINAHTYTHTSTHTLNITYNPSYQLPHSECIRRPQKEVHRHFQYPQIRRLSR